MIRKINSILFLVALSLPCVVRTEEDLFSDASAPDAPSCNDEVKTSKSGFGGTDTSRKAKLTPAERQEKLKDLKKKMEKVLPLEEEYKKALQEEKNEKRIEEIKQAMREVLCEDAGIVEDSLGEKIYGGSVVSMLRSEYKKQKQAARNEGIKRGVIFGACGVIVAQIIGAVLWSKWNGGNSAAVAPIVATAAPLAPVTNPVSQ